MLRTLVDPIEALPPPPNCSEVTTQILTLRRFDYYLRASVSRWVKSPRYLLNDDVRDDLIRMAGPNGVCHSEADLKGREEYFAAVRARIAELTVEVVEFPPTDLAYLPTRPTDVFARIRHPVELEYKDERTGMDRSQNAVYYIRVPDP